MKAIQLVLKFISGTGEPGSGQRCLKHDGSSSVGQHVRDASENEQAHGQGSTWFASLLQALDRYWRLGVLEPIGGEG